MTIDDADALGFFNELSIRLDIELDPPAQPAAPHLLNLVASPGARVKSVIARALVVDEDDDRALTEEEAARIVLRAPSIRLGRLDAEGSVEHRAPDGETFSVHDLLGAIAETERQLRAGTNWMGGDRPAPHLLRGTRRDARWRVGVRLGLVSTEEKQPSRRMTNAAAARRAQPAP